MPDQISFLKAIRENLDDIDLRLVYADWLEDNSDPLADFVRLQCELLSVEPFSERWCDLDQEAEHTLYYQRKKWLGPLAEREHLDPKPNGVLEHIFKGGVVEGVDISFDLLLELGETILEQFPTVHEMTLFDVKYRGAELAKLPILDHVDSLTICCNRFARKDLEDLLCSRHLQNLKRLEVWLIDYRSGYEIELTRGLSDIGRLPNLNEVILFEADEDYAGQADEIVDEINATLADPILRIEWEKDRLYSIRGDIEWGGLVAGHLPDDQPCLLIPWATEDHLALALFDQAGAISEIQRFGPFSKLFSFNVAEADYWKLERAMLDFVQDRFRFRPGLIRIKRLELEEESVYLQSHGFDDRDDQACHTCYSMIRRGEYTIDRGGDGGWANHHGKVHST